MGARTVPSELVAWKIPDACVRACAGKTSATRLAATAHSPPTPIATRKRNTPTSASECAKYVNPDEKEYIKIVRAIVGLRPQRSAIEPNNNPPAVPPSKKTPRNI